MSSSTQTYVNDTLRSPLAFLLALIAADGGSDFDATSSTLLLLSSPWTQAVVCSAMVGLSGLFPVFLLSFGKASDRSQHLMLSFACGSLLGDVFLHLLPEAYERLRDREDCHFGHLVVGLQVLLGILTFMLVEMGMSHHKETNNNHDDQRHIKGIKVSGYLNLVANCVDNFTHGLAVGGAFLVSTRSGFVTTSCILAHEIPHEIGDFAILMDSGFGVAAAAKAQVTTAALGVAGAMLALALNSFSTIDAVTSWIIPFTSGGFLHISLVSVLPQLVRSGDTKTVIGVTAGILVMAAVSQL